MKKILFTIGILYVAIFANAQKKIEPIQIQNTPLKNQLIGYIYSVDQWAKENHIKGYVLLMDETGANAHTVFRIRTAVLDTDLDKTQPSYYTIINNRCVLITTSLERLVGTDPSLLLYIKQNYAGDLIKSKDLQDAQNKEIEEYRKAMPDTTFVSGKNGDVKVAKSTVKLGGFPPRLQLPFKAPHAIEVEIDKNTLVSVKQILIGQ